MKKVLFESNINGQFSILDDKYAIVASGVGEIETNLDFKYITKGSTIYEANNYQYPGLIEITLVQEGCGINGNWQATLINESTGLTVFEGLLSNFVLQVNNLDSFSSYTVVLKDLNKEYNSLCRTTVYPEPDGNISDSISVNLRILEVPRYYYDIVSLDIDKSYYFILLSGNGLAENLSFKFNDSIVPMLKTVNSVNAWSLDDFEVSNYIDFIDADIYLVDNEFVRYDATTKRILRGLFDTPPMNHESTSYYIHLPYDILDSIIVEADSGAQYNLIGTLGKNISYSINSMSDLIKDRKNAPDTMAGVNLCSNQIYTYENGVLGDINISGGIRLEDDIWRNASYNYDDFLSNLIGKIEVRNSSNVIEASSDSYKLNIYNSTLQDGNYTIKCFIHDNISLMDSIYPFEFKLDIYNQLWTPEYYASIILKLDEESSIVKSDSNKIIQVNAQHMTLFGNANVNDTTFNGPSNISSMFNPTFTDGTLLFHGVPADLIECAHAVNMFAVLDITAGSTNSRIIELNEDGVGSHFNVSITSDARILVGYRTNTGSEYKYSISFDSLSEGKHMLYTQIDYFSGKIITYVDGIKVIDEHIQSQTNSFHFSNSGLRTIVFGNENGSQMILDGLILGTNFLTDKSIDLYFGYMSTKHNIKNLLPTNHPYKTAIHYSHSGDKSYNLNGEYNA